MDRWLIVASDGIFPGFQGVEAGQYAGHRTARKRAVFAQDGR